MREWRAGIRVFVKRWGIGYQQAVLSWRFWHLGIRIMTITGLIWMREGVRGAPDRPKEREYLQARSSAGIIL